MKAENDEKKKLHIMLTIVLKGCNCHFPKWQLHPLSTKGTIASIRVKVTDSNECQLSQLDEFKAENVLINADF